MLKATGASRAPEIATTGPPNPYLLEIRDLVYQLAGIFQPDNKLDLLADRCQKRMAAVGITQLRDYLDCLTIQPIRQAELVELLNAITIGETYFFRNQPQLDAFRRVVLPAILECKAGPPRQTIRIWSAGCSTGEEPYTLAIILLEESATVMKGWSFEIVATDLNERSIVQARRGIYGEYSARKLTNAQRQKFFTQTSEGLAIKDEVKANVRFNRVNLLDDSRMAFIKGMDVILCCNVLIYFDVASKRRVLQHFCNNLLPHGYFFVGSAESLYNVTQDFSLVHFAGTTGYERNQQRQTGNR